MSPNILFIPGPLWWYFVNLAKVVTVQQVVEPCNAALLHAFVSVFFLFVSYQPSPPASNSYAYPSVTAHEPAYEPVSRWITQCTVKLDCLWGK